MRDDPTRREKRVLQVILLCSTIWIILTVAITRIADVIFETWSTEWRIGIQIATVIISIGVLFLSEEALVKLILSSFSVTPKKDKEIEGHWAIYIVYFDKDNDKIERNGAVQFINTPVGLTLKGDKLFDVRTQKTVVESWVAEIAEVIHDGPGKTLLYSYKIRRPDNPDTFDKVGYVVATCANDDIPTRTFRGSFIDLAIAPNSTGEELRKGNVVIFKSHKK